MITALPAPVFVLERETGRMTLLSTVEELANFAEEFWDILADDFTLWDSEGFPLAVGPEILERNLGGLKRRGPCEISEVKRRLLAAAGHPTAPDAESLPALYAHLSETAAGGDGWLAPSTPSTP